MLFYMKLTEIPDKDFMELNSWTKSLILAEKLTGN